jgi:hypothetical protein
VHRMTALAVAAALVAAACNDPAVDVSGVERAPVAAKQDKLGSSGPVVMSGLDNPRGLAFAPNGALYVAEAGRGPVDPGCFARPEDCSCVQAGQLFCYGPTGAVSRLWKGRQERVATGLPSHANAAGRAQGPNDIAMLGVGGAHVAIGLEASPFLRDQLAAAHPAWESFGTLVHLPASGKWRVVADIAAYEKAVNPDPRIFDSNPYGLLALPGGFVLADAGGNSLLQVAASYDISTLAVMPRVPQATSRDAVPTSVAIGPDGAYYVGVLTGAPFADGAASVYRLVPGHEPQPFRTGFKAIIDIAFDTHGNLYVLQHATGPTMLTGPGVLIRVAPDGTRTTVLGGLTRPTSVAVGPDGALYVTNNGLAVGAGEVLRIEP